MDRLYSSVGIRLKESVVEVLILWNISCNNENFDFTWIQFVLIDVFGGKALADRIYDQEQMDFVKEIFSHRVKSDAARNSKFVDHVNQICVQFKEKREKDIHFD